MNTGTFSQSHCGKYAKNGEVWLSGSFNNIEFELYQRGMKYAAKKGATWVANEPGHMMFTGFGALVRSDLEISADEFVNMLKRSDEKVIGGKVCRIHEGSLQPKAAERYFLGMGFMGVHSGKCSGSMRIWIDSEGLIREFHVRAEMEGTVKGRPLTMTVERTIELSELDKTGLDLPEEVEKLLQQK